MLFKVTIELGLKNRNPLFPELDREAVCNVVIGSVCLFVCVSMCRGVWEKEGMTKTVSLSPVSRIRP